MMVLLQGGKVRGNKDLIAGGVRGGGNQHLACHVQMLEFSYYDYLFLVKPCFFVGEPEGRDGHYGS